MDLSYYVTRSPGYAVHDRVSVDELNARFCTDTGVHPPLPLLTLTLTALEVAVLPLASVTTAVKV